MRLLALLLLASACSAAPGRESSWEATGEAGSPAVLPQDPEPSPAKEVPPEPTAAPSEPAAPEAPAADPVPAPEATPAPTPCPTPAAEPKYLSDGECDAKDFSYYLSFVDDEGNVVVRDMPADCAYLVPGDGICQENELQFSTMYLWISRPLSEYKASRADCGWP